MNHGRVGTRPSPEPEVQACTSVVVDHCAVERNRQVLVEHPREASSELRAIQIPQRFFAYVLRLIVKAREMAEECASMCGYIRCKMI
jgi:hypothetical protein